MKFYHESEVFRMTFWSTLGCIVLILMSLPYLRFLLIRLKSSVKIRIACKKHGYTLIPAHPFPFFGRMNSETADFYVRANDASKVYCVKLSGAVHRLQTLYMIEGNKYQWVRQIPLFGWFSYAIVHEHESRIRDRVPVDYIGDFDEYSVGRCIPVLLMCPAPMAVKRAKLVPDHPSTQERLPMFTKRGQSGYTVQRQRQGGAIYSAFSAISVTDNIYDGAWVTNEYLFSTAAFCNELFCSCLEY